MLIAKGDTGPAVCLVQERLRELGCFKGAEADCGPLTREAVRRFQQSQGLAPDGVAGPRTWARLFPPQRCTREYLEEVLYRGGWVWDILDEVVAAVAAGEGGAFDALQLNRDGAGLSFGILQWAQLPGSLQPLLQAMQGANEAKFTAILGEGDPGTARDLLGRTRGRGKELVLWQAPWPLRFWLAGREPEFQRVQHHLARSQLATHLQDGYSLYPQRFKPGGRIAVRAMVMLADVGNQAGPAGLRRALQYAASRTGRDEAGFIRALGEYVENLIRRKYGDPDFGNTRGRHEAICNHQGLDKVDWPALRAGRQLFPGLRG